jgi:hypothetical protein
MTKPMLLKVSLFTSNLFIFTGRFRDYYLPDNYVANESGSEKHV